jgi:hypothetical protein
MRVWPSPLTPEFDSRYIVGITPDLYDEAFDRDHQEGGHQYVSDIMSAAVSLVIAVHEGVSS